MCARVVSCEHVYVYKVYVLCVCACVLRPVNMCMYTRSVCCVCVHSTLNAMKDGGKTYSNKLMMAANSNFTNRTYENENYHP